MIVYVLATGPHLSGVRKAFEERSADPATGPPSASPPPDSRSMEPASTRTPRSPPGSPMERSRWYLPVGPRHPALSQPSRAFGRGPATGKPDSNLAPKWPGGARRLNNQTVFDFTSDNGATRRRQFPARSVIDAKGEVIGAAFDGNPNRWAAPSPLTKESTARWWSPRRRLRRPCASSTGQDALVAELTAP